MTLKSGMVATVLISLAVLVGAGCDSYTCEGACGQYYLDCGQPSILSDGTTAEEAARDCTRECTDAMYTTTEDSGGMDDRGYTRLESQSDAEEFINCVAEKDYSAAAFNSTCDLLDLSCPWFRW